MKNSDAGDASSPYLTVALASVVHVANCNANSTPFSIDGAPRNGTTAFIDCASRSESSFTIVYAATAHPVFPKSVNNACNGTRAELLVGL